MIRNSNEEELVQSLYTKITQHANIELTKEAVKANLFIILRIDPNKSSKLQEEYQRFYMNKMLHSSRPKIVEEHLYKPKLNPVSIKLAEKSRDRRIASSSGKFPKRNMTIMDLLPMIKKEETKNANTQRKYSTKGISGKDKSETLFNRSKKLRRVYDKTTEEVEYEKSKNELTFTPKISRWWFL